MKNKIYDCFQFFDENEILEIRLNTLDKYVDYFVIIEARQNHRGDPKPLNFDKERFKKFESKIIYIPVNLPDIKKVKDPQLMDQFQRNQISLGLKNASPEDFIIISDVDEIPNLEIIDFNSVYKKIVIFKQMHFYFKLNLLARYPWLKSKMCRKKNLISPQWLRNIKPKKYPFYRIDTMLNKSKYRSVQIVDDGGWHFSYIKDMNLIKHKLSSFAHHELDTPDFNNISNIKHAIHNKVNIFDENSDLKLIEVDESYPEYILKNINKYLDHIAKNKI